jgi:oligopeptide transport system ATP-binding protein
MNDINNINKDKDIILSVRDLVVKFTLRGKTLTAIRGISLDLYEGESLAIVGESGSGKSVFTRSFMGMLDANGRVDAGEILYKGTNIAEYKTEKEWLAIRGREIAMVFQDPMTSLNPLKTVGRQIRETVELHQKLGGAEAKAATLAILRDVGIANRRSVTGNTPTNFRAA